MTISALGFWTAFEDFSRKYCPRISGPFAPSVCPPMEDPATQTPRPLPAGPVFREPSRDLSPLREENERTQASAPSNREAKRRKWLSTVIGPSATDQQTQAIQRSSPPQDGQREWQAVQPLAGSASPNSQPDSVINQLEKMTAEQNEHRGALDVVINHLKEIKEEQDLQRGAIFGMSGSVCQMAGDLQAIQEDIRSMRESFKAFLQSQGI